MEFLIPKTKRCGRLILRSRRREAARIVFFALLSLFLPAGLAAASARVPDSAVLSLWGTGLSLPAASLFIIAAILFVTLFHLPLFFGIKRWFLMLCRPERMRKPSPFYFFSSFRLYAKAVLTGLFLAIQRLVFYFCGTAPALSALLVSVVFFRRVPNDLGCALSLLCLAASAGLFFCGIQAARAAAKRFFWIPWLLANDPSLSLVRILLESARLTRQNGEALYKVRRAARGKKLFFLFPFAFFWAISLTECTLAAWLSEKLPAPHADPFRRPFRLRRTKRAAFSS